MNLDHQLCYCYHISKRKIINFVKQTRPKRASQISDCYEAGSGCGWCIPFLIKIHRQVVGGEAVEEDNLSPEEYASLRLKYHQDMKEGACQKNTYDATSSRAAGAEELPEISEGELPETPEKAPDEPGEMDRKPGAKPEKQPRFDYTRYFSRSRPDPEPETLH
jgi:bacterioferritin-associated ferredoxin